MKWSLLIAFQDFVLSICGPIEVCNTLVWPLSLHIASHMFPEQTFCETAMLRNLLWTECTLKMLVDFLLPQQVDSQLNTSLNGQSLEFDLSLKCYFRYMILVLSH